MNFDLEIYMCIAPLICSSVIPIPYSFTCLIAAFNPRVFSPFKPSSARSNRKWCKRRGSSLECQNCFFVYPIIDSNLINLAKGRGFDVYSAYGVFASIKIIQGILEHHFLLEMKFYHTFYSRI